MLKEMLASGIKPIAVVAPSARANFKIGKLINTLREIGFKEVYDVSFGADITTWAYIRYIQRFSKKSVIAQPCPAVVNYIEKHIPQLLDYLIPVQSPMMCVSIFLKKYLKKTEPIVFISPCIAKKDEIARFPDIVQLNVTYISLMEEFGDVYNRAADTGKFDYAEGYLGKLFSRPGGLKENVHAYFKDAKVKQIEGDIIFEYLEKDYLNTPDNQKPLIVDILNCHEGCNKGTATKLDVPIDVIDYEFDVMKKSTYNKFKSKRLFKFFDKKLKLEDFMTTYSNKSKYLEKPSSDVLENIYNEMLKTSTEKRNLNCSACGYDSCEEMAIAIYYGYNRKENCVNYLKDKLSLENEELYTKNIQINKLLDNINNTQKQLEELINEVAFATDVVDRSMQEIAVGYSESAKEIENISTSVSGLLAQIKLLDSISKELSTKIDILNKTNNILQDIGSSISLYALNASIEASKITESKGFSVIASEIRKLADRMKVETSIVKKEFDTMISLMNQIPDLSEKILNAIENINSSLVNESALIEELTAKSEEISAEISRLNALIQQEGVLEEK
ncbi:[Fe-Fe] hydrogenase large subunit C-terminal domain-containing protein [Caldicellulosiruptor naganoensis]|uniref:Methyl-accepting chemotaxis protein n=1 Tax=Caldicellulosiruptor naganoensis TaxID=29324 RepID=A0ABY7BK21_9FIRM|nr:[Fe-Fe] hydrogenase large subunit C-terminal domain-containing protein [Caldicellulosiruptor naganoensis]WAM31926.1 methyl-accepting chemotaxis protein [Caldicellulosiruptor naganoensis]